MLLRIAPTFGIDEQSIQCTQNSEATVYQYTVLNPAAYQTTGHAIWLGGFPQW